MANKMAAARKQQAAARGGKRAAAAAAPVKGNGKGGGGGEAVEKANNRPPPKRHERKMKLSEAELLERGRAMAARYLEQRDGMDPQIALDIVEGMAAEEINELITEANSAVLETLPAAIPGAAGTGPAAADAAGAPMAAAGGSLNPPEGAAAGAVLVGAKTAEEEDKGPAPDFLEIPGLAASEDFPTLVVECIDSAKDKNVAEAKYKLAKVKVIALMKDAGAPRVQFLDAKLTVYTGHNLTLDKFMLMEKGVSIDIINQCWKDTPYEDVRIYVPKPPKATRGL